MLGLAAFALGWQLVVAIVMPPFAYDAITYHLTIVATRPVGTRPSRLRGDASHLETYGRG